MDRLRLGGGGQATPGSVRRTVHATCMGSTQRQSRCRAAVEQSSLPKLQHYESIKFDVAWEQFEMVKSGRLVKQNTSFVEQHRVRGYECGPDHRLTLVSLANILQEAAGNHAVALWGRSENGFATDPYMEANNLLFAMVRLEIQLETYPKWGDIVEVETFFGEDGRVRAWRDWVIKNSSTGEKIGEANSKWVLLNSETRRLSKLPDEVRARVRACSNQENERVRLNNGNLKISDLEMPAQIEGPQQVARHSDVDMNGHINNVTYIAWALEIIPEEVYSKYKVAEIKIDFKAECLAGEKVEVLGQEGGSNGTQAALNGAAHGPSYTHLIRCCNDQQQCRELTRAITVWEKL